MQRFVFCLFISQQWFHCQLMSCIYTLFSEKKLPLAFYLFISQNNVLLYAKIAVSEPD